MCKLTYYLVISAFLCTVGGCRILGHKGMERLDIGKLPTKSAPDGTVKVEHIVYRDEQSKYLLYESKNSVTGEFVKIQGSTKKGYRKIEYRDKSDLAIEKYFFPNGSLKSVHQCHIGFPHSNMERTRRPLYYVGISREYNRTGKLIKETDHEKPFGFTLDKVKELISEKYEPDLDRVGKVGEITRFVMNGVGFWQIKIPPRSAGKKWLSLVLDGHSGEITSQEEYDIETRFPL